jgi:glutamate synthase (ferredoxin)
MMRVCHLNTCPVGITTQDPALRKRFTGDPEHLVTFMRFIAEEVREHMAALGFRTFDEMVGRSDRIEMRRAVDHPRARTLDFARILHRPAVPEHVGRRASLPQEHAVDGSLDAVTLIPLARPALEAGAASPVRATLSIRNTDRSVGTMLGGEVTRRWGGEGLPDDTIHLRLEGSAGLSFGAFLPRGVTLELEGDANDYFGKGLSGGRIAVFPPAAAGPEFVAEENVIIGNVALYGATSGEAFIRGLAGERFAVRNSGASAVVEGIGDHGCEYMTGGRVVVLGPTGRNFAAGMSGGIAYVLDEDGGFVRRCNREMVELSAIDDASEAGDVRRLVETHARWTESERARLLLADWDATLARVVRVMPHEYSAVLEAERRARERGLADEAVPLAAFEEVARARAGAAAAQTAAAVARAALETGA